VALHRSVLLGLASIFGYKWNGDIEYSVMASYPFGDVRDGLEEPTIQLLKCMEGKLI